MNLYHDIFNKQKMSPLLVKATIDELYTCLYPDMTSALNTIEKFLNILCKNKQITSYVMKSQQSSHLIEVKCGDHYVCSDLMRPMPSATYPVTSQSIAHIDDNDDDYQLEFTWPFPHGTEVQEETEEPTVSEEEMLHTAYERAKKATSDM